MRLYERLGDTGWAVAPLVGVACAAASACVFGSLLGVPLPAACSSTDAAPIVEKTLGQTLFMAHGDWRLRAYRPLSLVLLLLGAVVLPGPPVWAALRRRRAPAASAA